ncbi:C40 family peptidase [Oscillatoria sp. FACHB-1407]|uniref:C40 family peptidase n=1 Tax=Oscillatoria sp. FACHB-1407 TaxID=2692847 RepID=UPI0016842F6D|nr:C40 family peptidase [Oscillatoria sp. FACHB-1407]MBD2464725.1 C40 family peptidase [Oscillatoria sp. FACHB-1407]
MVSLAELHDVWMEDHTVEYECQANLNLYDAPTLKTLATQAVFGRQLRILPLPTTPEAVADVGAIQVCLCEDAYSGWIAVEDLDMLMTAEAPYRAIAVSEIEIRDRLPQVIAYAQAAMKQPNYYLWGGTVGPNYDCSGLVQTAFASVGVWLPRDSYQQEAFVQPISLDALEPGDLLFFGKPERCSHVALYLGNGEYIHSSGKEQGRNGIGIDRLSEEGDAVSQAYFRQFRGAGRVTASFVPAQRDVQPSGEPA